MTDLTLLSVNWNQRPAMELMLKSYVKYHWYGDPLKLMLWDNGSTDDSKEWLHTNGIPFFDSKTNIGHENAVCVCYPSITTRYVCLVDSDIIFKDSVNYYLQNFSSQIIAAGDLIRGDQLDAPVKPRLGAWFVLFDILRCRQEGILTFRDNEDWSYDVASQFYENLWTRNLDVHIIPRLPGDIDKDPVGMQYRFHDHLGKLSWNVSEHMDREWEIGMRKEYVLKRLEEFKDVDLKGKFC